ncbi:hypothetical protein [Saccharothrix yanglingensis]|uniref:Uncharacterized protein n=1 Tax=Saccharothrix yanglingensis TaxID=659496 RepID=A0ABU0XAE9_9PSEU|nr:hypothetical protein [Saccharothrix yanglingensis]MDQ2589125.1 hypothetical protein [Saccharothrix yanglingensis]
MDDTITVERVGHALLVASRGADGDAAALAAALAPERYRTAVVVGASAVEAVARLDPWVIADLDEHVSGSVRLVAPNLAATGPDGELPPAHLLAERLGVEVVAPDDALVPLQGGNVFVAGSDAGWVAYRPDGGRRRSGPRHPAPWWQELLPRDAGEQIPLGLWLRAPGSPERADDPLRTRVPDPGRLTVVVGAPGEPAPGVPEVAEVLRALPGEARDRAVLVCYGCDVAQALADELGGPVRALHGVPGPDGPVHLDECGDPTWRPFALESVYLPGAAPVVDRWLAPVPSMTMVAPAAYRLAEGWRLDVLPRGVLARPDDLVPDPAWSEPAGATADLVVAAGGAVPATVVTALAELVRALPDDVRENLRVVPTSPFAADAVRGLPGWDDPDDAPRRHAVVVTPDGRVLPAEPLLAVSPAAADLVVHLDQVPEVSDKATAAPAVGVPRRAPDRPVAPVEVVGVDAVVGVPEPEGSAPIPATATVARRAAVPAPVAPPLVAPTSQPVAPAPRPVAPLPTQPAPSAPAAATAPAAPAPTPTATPAPVPPPVAPEPTSRVPDLTSALPAAVSSLTAPPSPRRTPPVEPITATPPAGPEPIAGPEQATGPTTGTLADRVEATPAEPVRPSRREPLQVPRDARSTAGQRAAVRAALGSRYDVANRAVARLLAERPGLRAPGADAAALTAELTVVRVFALDHEADHDLDFHTCLAAGLRRLPTLRGVVLRGAPVDADHRVGTVLTLPEPTLAGNALPARPVPGTEVLIWSTTARRLDGLLDDDRRDDVLLPAHTRLRVLAVEETDRRRVLLAEEGTPEDQALKRLRATVAARAATGPADEEEVTRWFGDLPVS